MFLFNSWNLINWYHRFDSKFGVTLTREDGLVLNIENGVESAGTTSQDNARALNKLQQYSNADYNDINPLRYPLDLGSNKQHRHMLQISIFTQNISSERNRNTGIVPGNRFDTNTTSGGLGQTLGVNTTGYAEAGAVKNLDQIAGFTKGRAAQQKVTAFVSGIKTVVGAVEAVRTSDFNVNTSTTSKEAIGYINLYMPETLNFVNQQDFDAVSMTEALGLAGLFSQAGATGTEAALVAASGIGAVGDKYRDAFLQKNLGYALNPQLEILYSGPKNREFIFSFKFTPRSSPEADAVWDIIHTLKFHAAPEYNINDGKQQARYLVPPSQFGLDFQRVESDGNLITDVTLPRVGPCVLTNIDVNYAPSGKYATFYDGMPVEIQMQLSFTETIILTKDDIRNGF